MSQSFSPTELAITLILPPDLVGAIAQKMEPGQTQAEAILALLRSALQPPHHPSETGALVARVTQLETLVPRLEALERAIAPVITAATQTTPKPPSNHHRHPKAQALAQPHAQPHVNQPISQPTSQPNPEPMEPELKTPEIRSGSMVAQLWLQTSQDKAPPASIPSTLMPLLVCPKCSSNLAPPLKASGRQICMRCSWTDKSLSLLGQEEVSLPAVKSADKSPGMDVADQDLMKLMAQAAAASLDNMKPRRKQED